jgi:hypothetical protein
MIIRTTEKMASELHMSVEDLLEDYRNEVITREARINNRRGVFLWDRTLVINSYKEKPYHKDEKALYSSEKETSEVRRMENLKKWVSHIEASGLPKKKHGLRNTYMAYVHWSRGNGVADSSLYGMQKNFAIAMGSIGYKRAREEGNKQAFYSICLP